ncbi:Tn3 family transposase [Actinoallomurus iriomotensis]|uniref:Tn3 family transposase n=1 Tax=Actinoallomurus iriomotensis TaxID=478107 RepID=UPI0025549F47|nr:Tn3 family transposase [Actinoallomurus iriomotensis]
MSIYTGQVRAHDVMKMAQRDGNPTQLGEAIAHYGRIFKTLLGSPFGRKHINVIGTYSFTAPDLGSAGVRELRDPDADDEDD